MVVMSVDEIKSLFKEYAKISNDLPNYRISKNNDAIVIRMLKRRDDLEEYFTKNHLYYLNNLDVDLNKYPERIRNLFNEYERILENLSLISTFKKDDKNVSLLLGRRKRLEEIFAQNNVTYSVSVDSTFLKPDYVRAFK